MLGIIGATMLLLLFSYSLRKRFTIFSFLGPLPSVFQKHIWLGIAGPICILWHCRYQLGAINSNFALFSMIIVAVSGIFGRFIQHKLKYQRIFLLWKTIHVPVVFTMVFAIILHIVSSFLY